MNPYEELANAIILQAVKDYWLTDDERELQEIERFLRSGWFGVLSKSIRNSSLKSYGRRSEMTAKEYLSQARTLDMRIKSKLQQIESLNELATSCTVVYSDMPRNPNRGGSKIEQAVLKIIEVEESLKHDVEDLVELKKEIMATIRAVSDVELQTLLEKRYLCFLSWEKIAVEMHYSIQHIYRMHDTALSCVAAIMRVNERD